MQKLSIEKIILKLKVKKTHIVADLYSKNYNTIKVINAILEGLK